MGSISSLDVMLLGEEAAKGGSLKPSKLSSFCVSHLLGRRKLIS